MKYRILAATLIPIAMFSGLTYAAFQTLTLVMGLDPNESFIVNETDEWRVKLERYLTLRYADVLVEPKHNSNFSLMLYFKCDSPDLSVVDTPGKMKKVLLTSSKPYLSSTVEKKLELKELNFGNRFGFMGILTDASLNDDNNIPPGEFRYMTRGMIRLTDETALGFSLMTNSLGDGPHKKALDYIAGFVQPTEE